MNNKIGTRAKIPPKSRNYIIARAIAPPRISRRVLAKKLQQELEEKGFDVPEVEVLWRMISQARNYQPSELDEDWSLGSLADYPIPPEVLLACILFQIGRTWKDERLSIRESLWAGRLYTLFTTSLKGVDNPLQHVEDWAWLYSLEERVFEIQGKVFDSIYLDMEMMRNFSYASEARKAFLMMIKIDNYDVDLVKLKSLNLPLEETEETVKANPEKFILTKEALSRYDGAVQYFEDYNKEVGRIMAKLRELPRSRLKSLTKRDKPVKEKK